MLNRTDLRTVPADDRAVGHALPRAAVDVESVSAAVRVVLDDVRRRGAEAVRELTSRFDQVDLDALRVPVGELAAARDGLDPAVRAGLRGVDPPGPAGARGAAADRRHDPGRPRRHRHRALGTRRPGRPLRARRPGRLSVQRRDERGAGAGRRGRRRWPSRRRRSGSTAACPHPAILAACALLGVDEVYAVGGAQAVAMFAYGTDGVPPGGHGHRSRQRLRRSRQTAAARRGRHRLRGRADRDRGPRRRLRRPGVRRRRPHQPGRARHRWPPRSWSPTARRSPTPSTRSWSRRSRPPSTSSGSPRPCTGAVRDGPRRRPRRRAWRSSTPTRPSTSRYHPRRRRGGRRGSSTPGAIFVGPYSPVSLGDYCAGSNHVLPTGGTARHASGLSVQSFLQGIHVVDYDRGRPGRGRRARRGPGARRGPPGARRGRSCEARDERTTR